MLGGGGVKNTSPGCWAGTRFNLVYSAVGSYGASQIHFGFANIQLYYQFPINVLLLYAICWQNDACFTFDQMF